MDNRLNATYEGKGYVIGILILIWLAVLGTAVQIAFTCF